jgi:hypothetical protein
LDFASAFDIPRFGSTGVKSYISDRLISDLQHLASYVYRHNAMAYDSITSDSGKCFHTALGVRPGNVM